MFDVCYSSFQSIFCWVFQRFEDKCQLFLWLFSTRDKYHPVIMNRSKDITKFIILFVFWLTMILGEFGICLWLFLSWIYIIYHPFLYIIKHIIAKSFQNEINILIILFILYTFLKPFHRNFKFYISSSFNVQYNNID